MGFANSFGYISQYVPYCFTENQAILYLANLERYYYLEEAIVGNDMSAIDQLEIHFKSVIPYYQKSIECLEESPDF